jgi:hypothetical protein
VIASIDFVSVEHESAAALAPRGTPVTPASCGFSTLDQQPFSDAAAGAVGDRCGGAAFAAGIA